MRTFLCLLASYVIIVFSNAILNLIYLYWLVFHLETLILLILRSWLKFPDDVPPVGLFSFIVIGTWGHLQPKEQCPSIWEISLYYFFDNFLPIFLLFILSGIPISWILDPLDWVSDFSYLSILMFTSLILGPVLERFSWHFYQSSYLNFYFNYYIFLNQRVIFLIAPLCHSVLFHGFNILLYIPKDTNDEISKCSFVVSIAFLSSGDPFSLFLSLPFMSASFTDFSSIERYLIFENEALGHEWKFCAGEPYPGGLEANWVFHCGDITWSGCQYL